MRQALLVHPIALAVVFGATAFIIWAMGPELPAWARDVWLALAGGYFLVWAGLLAIRVRSIAAGRDDPIRWGRHDLIILWLGSLVSTAAFWIMMPFADPRLRLVVVIVLYSGVTVHVFGSIRRPPDRPGSPLLPIIHPVTIGLYYLVHWERNSIVLIPVSFAHAWLVHVLRGVLQGAVDSAIAARRTAETALQEVAAERDARSRFLASVSHDLGQPLQAARLFFDQALRGPSPDQRQRAAEKAAWALDGAQQLLSQMLDQLRLDSGSVEARLAMVAIGPLIARVAELNEPAARLAGVRVSALPSRLKATADAALVERILGNLAANAIRHAGGRRLLMGARRRQGRVRVWVIDDGAGIAEADVPRLFEDFVQGSDHGDRIRGGFGLGLASARRMAGLMGAEVGLDRGWRAGSAFWLELPAWEAEPPLG